MPVTKTAKRALRSSNRKRDFNSLVRSKLEATLRVAIRTKKPNDIKTAISSTDKAVKKNLIHKNRAGRIKAKLSKLSKN